MARRKNNQSEERDDNKSFVEPVEDNLPSAQEDNLSDKTFKSEPNPVGRPSKYDPSYCDMVIELGKLGKSFEQMASQLHVSYRTLCRWRDEHPDFRHALEDAQAFEQAWWEEMAQSYLVNTYQGDSLNASMWSRSMAARFPKKYSDRSKVELTGKDGGAVEIDHINHALEDLLGTLEKKLG